ncbi:GGDEF domain-containing protein [Methylobacillus gramineus]|uniref:GGDEF domain-containing protein n=1 Tax=Methylobacillus gramineus TaxID=755169 RepID=UPI001CFFA207|nr:GGDEF domain-containing protein [Methylobacillus gramineus]MCB5185057.1 GGDEF domain-containing protein [Methylobacillus gramineus]
MIIARRIHEISGVLDLNLAQQRNKKQFIAELKIPSLSLQSIALIGLIAAYAVGPRLTKDILLEVSGCVVGILAGIFISHLSRNMATLNIGGFITVLFACIGFRLILVAAERTAIWTLPVGALIAVSIAVIVSSPGIYSLLIAVVWFVLDIDFGVAGAPQNDGLWPQLLTSTAIVIGLLLNAVLSRLRRVNELCTLRLIDMAYKDHLTGIPNRRWFIEAVDLALKASHLDGYLLILDVDNFKRINDESGHDIGDEVLKGIGSIISTVAAGLPYGRIGGEEFSIVVRGKREDAEGLAERLLQAVRGAPISGRHVTVSIGASFLQGKSIFISMRKADDALYRAKVSGKDRVVFCPEQPVGSI